MSTIPTCKHFEQPPNGVNVTITPGPFVCPWCEIERLERELAAMKEADEMLATAFMQLKADRDRLRAALKRIANGDPNQISSPLGPLHAAGIRMQWEIDAKICREALDGNGGDVSATGQSSSGAAVPQ